MENEDTQITKSSRKWTAFSALTLLLLGSAGWYGWQMLPKHPIASAPDQAPNQGALTIPLPDAAVVSLHDVRRNLPPFTLALPAPTSDAERLQFIASSYDNGRAGAPEVAMAKAFLQTPAARATAEWLRTRANTPLSAQWYRDFQASYPDWPLTITMRRKAEIALLTGQTADADKRAYFLGTPPETTTGRIYWARALLSNGETTKALDLIRPVWRQEKLLASTEQQLRDSFSKLFTGEDHRARMVTQITAKNWEGALRSAKDVGGAAEDIIKARMAVVQKAKNAQALIEALPKDTQNDPLVALSKLLLLVQQKKSKDAATLMGKVAESSKKPENRDLSAGECRDWQGQQRMIIRQLLDDNAYDDAYGAASAQLSKLGCIHGDADFLAGWISLRFLNKPDQALIHFNTLATHARSAAQKARAAYWQGRVAEQKGDSDTAKDAYARAARQWMTFYGQLAADKLPVSPLRPAPAPVAADDQGSLMQMMSVQALRLLDDGGAQDIAITLYSELAATLIDRKQLEALAAMAEEQRNARALLSIARIASRRGFDIGTLGYPTFGIPDVQDTKRTVEKPLIYAITHQESAFNPKAKSHAGALGLMQLMPETARSTAQRSNVAFDIERLTADPAYNTGLGAAHLKDLLSDWNGSLILSMAAYNAGGGNVKKWITAHGDPRLPEVDAIDWIERIPFYETRHYVQRISENLMIYRRLMGSREPSLFSREITTSSGPVAEPPKATP